MRGKYRKKVWLCAALAAVLCLMLALPQKNILARVLIDTSKKCSLTIDIEVLKAESETINGEDLKNAKSGIEVYLYRIASINGYGEYDLLDTDFSAAVEKDKSEGKYPIEWTIEELNRGVYRASAGEWASLARYIAKYLELPVISESDETDSITIPENLPEPLKKLTIEPSESTTATVNDIDTGLYLVWVKPVVTQEYEYTFLPYLVSLPNNEYGQIEDAQDEWLYDVTVGLKPQQNMHYIDLEIVKSLLTYNQYLGEAMFAFSVEATKEIMNAGGQPEEKLVYSDVLSLSFDEPGEKKTVAKRIPAGLKVTITELYTGSSYEVKGNGTIVIDSLSENDNSVKFTNDYNGIPIYGNGVVNQFAIGESGGWSWTPQKDNEDKGVENENVDNTDMNTQGGGENNEE